MSDLRESTTIFYKLKLKLTRKPIEVFEKMAKSVKKRGATKSWICEYDEESFQIDFGDEYSETFVISFDDKKTCNNFCKVCFPLSGELFDDEKKSEFKTLINMIYSSRTSFSEMEITDDYGISQSFLDSKVNKIALRELTDDEMIRAKRLFDSGYTSVKEFITALLLDLRGLEYSKPYYSYINIHVNFFVDFSDRNHSNFYSTFAESFLYEAAEYKDKGRLYECDEYYSDLNGLMFSTMAFCHGVMDVTDIFHLKSGGDPKGTQVFRLYHNKYLPLLENEPDPYGQCLLAYRFVMSIFDYLGFKYVGRSSKNLELISDNMADCIKLILENDYMETYKVFEKAVLDEQRRAFNIKRRT